MKPSKSPTRTPSFVLVVALAAAACSEETHEAPGAETKPTAPAPAVDAKKGAGEKSAPAAAPRALPPAPPLTDATALGVLHAQLELIAGEDLTRQALLYLADLKDKDGADAARKSLETKDGKYEDRSAAAVAIEALLAYGEPGAGAKALELAKQYAEAQEAPDEWLVHALGRVDSGPEKAAAVAALLKIATAEGDETTDVADVPTLATEALARMGAPEAGDALAKIAADGKRGGEMRGAAVAGLLRLSDPRGKSLGDKLVAQATAPVPEAGDPKRPAPKPDADEPPAPEEVIAGLGIEGAFDAGQYVKKTLDNMRADESNNVTVEGTAAAAAIARIYSKGGGQDLAPWLRELARKETMIESECALALWALGDDSSAQTVADDLRTAVSSWATPLNMDPAIEILDIAARRGAARSAAFRPIVDAAAQVSGANPQRGVDLNLRSLNIAAAHAFLKSAPK
jgi:hypothetical protein